MRSYFQRRSAFLVCFSALALLAISAPALAQCSGGSCAMPQSYGASFARQFNFAPPPAAPQLYQLADSEGTLYQHADPAYLQSWIKARNATMASMAKPAPAASPPPKADAPLCPCAMGRCPCEVKATAKAATFTPTPPPLTTTDILAIGPPPPSPW